MRTDAWLATLAVLSWARAASADWYQPGAPWPCEGGSRFHRSASPFVHGSTPDLPAERWRETGYLRRPVRSAAVVDASGILYFATSQPAEVYAIKITDDEAEERVEGRKRVYGRERVWTQVINDGGSVDASPVLGQLRMNPTSALLFVFVNAVIDLSGEIAAQGDDSALFAFWCVTLRAAREAL